MSKEFSLISTKLELEVCKNKKKVLAGNWCYQDNDKKKFHSNLVTNNPWSSPRDFNNDYKYIKNLLNRCIISIVEYLNKIHNKKTPLVAIFPFFILFVFLHLLYLSNSTESKDIFFTYQHIILDGDL